jgi:maltose alpha-D-glucosyltransferase/alpha-amylase
MKDIKVPEGVELHWISAEQSNSSVIVGDIAITKMFRCITDGPHPEAEMGRYLTEQGFAHTPALLGEVVRIDPKGVRHALAIAQAFVRNQGDAWTWTLDLLARGLSDITSGDEATARDAANHSDYAKFAELLGCRLGEMHVILARPSNDPAFAPVKASADDARAVAERVRTQVADAYKAIEANTQWEPAAEPDRQTVLGIRDALFDRLPTLARALQGATLTRIHGDLHLGQVLVVNGDVSIIDFEGEPARPVELRRAKDHPLRDVAGMIRSFAYAAAVMKRRSQSSHAHVPDEQVNSFLDSFVTRATESFLAGYRKAIASIDAESSVNLHQELLDLFLIEKAAYEVVYESANRPTWIDVPLHGLAIRTRHLLGVEAIA